MVVEHGISHVSPKWRPNRNGCGASASRDMTLLSLAVLPALALRVHPARPLSSLVLKDRLAVASAAAAAAVVLTTAPVLAYQELAPFDPVAAQQASDAKQAAQRAALTSKRQNELNTARAGAEVANAKQAEARAALANKRRNELTDAKTKQASADEARTHRCHPHRPPSPSSPWVSIMHAPTTNFTHRIVHSFAGANHVPLQDASRLWREPSRRHIGPRAGPRANHLDRRACGRAGGRRAKRVDCGRPVCRPRAGLAARRREVHERRRTTRGDRGQVNS